MTTIYDPNVPVYGMMAFVFLLSSMWYWWATFFGGPGSPTQRTVFRLVHEFPLIVLFVFIMFVRKPWGRG